MDRPFRTSQACSRSLTALTLLVVGLCSSGCSFNLGSLSPGGDKEDPKTTATAAPPTRSLAVAADPQESKAQTARGTSLAQAGQNDDALVALDTAVRLDPQNAQAFYQRGLIYLSDKRYEYAVADFTSASGLTPQQPDPLIGRAQCYLALGKEQEAAADLDEASSVAPGNVQVWMARGAAYEKLGNREKAADSFGRAVLLRPDDQAARSGVTRNGGKAG